MKKIYLILQVLNPFSTSGNIVLDVMYATMLVVAIVFAAEAIILIYL